ncbi:hypothetical protein [Campylobacter upsaliensis]|uniref:hypothetical protein n=1 Tax=Campylobacter upsaliensis TaxID=28080 RepID=UPI003A598B5C
MLKDSLIYVAGHRGTAGSAILEGLLKQGFNNIITKTHAELDLSFYEKANHFTTRIKNENAI